MSTHAIHNSASSSERAPAGGRADWPLPSRQQIAVTRHLLCWYFDRYHGDPANMGTLRTFTHRATVGAFAVSRSALRSGDEHALFRLLVAVTMFQRRQDQQILRILRSLSPEQVAELTSPETLRAMSDRTRCACLRTTAALHSRCDLTKAPGARLGTCGLNPAVTCHLKRHTIELRRYGHFGKVPTSAALTLRELNASGLADLRRQIWHAYRDRRERAAAIEAALCRVWRVSRKIAAMYLSLLTVPGLSEGPPIWRGLDWSRFVVIDSNTDLFLKAIGYPGPWTYDARLHFISALTSRLRESHSARARRAVSSRLVQQAMYAFMGRINRRANPRDCAFDAGACRSCPLTLRRLCPVMPGARTARVSTASPPSRRGDLRRSRVDASQGR